jgi:hypothetical protein
LIKFFDKFAINSKFLDFIIIFGAPILYIFSIFFNIGNFNFIFLLNKFAFTYLLLFFFYKNRKIFILYLIIAFIPVLIGEIAQVLPTLLIIMYLSFYKNLTFNKIITSIISFLILFSTLLITQDFFKKNYGTSSARVYEVKIIKNKLKVIKSNNGTFQKEYFSSQLLRTERHNYFKPESYIINDYLKLIYNRTLRRLSEINHTAVVKKMLDSKNADFLYGKTYERLPVLLVPRILYQEKPSETYGNILVCGFGIGNNFKSKNECIKNNITSINLNVILEGYINYKIYGLIFSSFFIALIAAISFKLVNSSRYFINIFGFSIMIQGMMYQSNLTGVIGGIILCIMAILPLMLFKRINET